MMITNITEELVIVQTKEGKCVYIEPLDSAEVTEIVNLDDVRSKIVINKGNDFEFFS